MRILMFFNTMDKKLKRYTVLPSDSDLTAISLVFSPAVELPFIALSKQNRTMQFKAVENGEKHYLYGVALRCDFDIYRKYGDEEFYINFSEEAIRRMMIKYFKNYGQKNWTLEHGYNFVEGLTICESWQVTDPDTDKATALGLEGVGKGDWIIGVDCSDNEIWNEIKDGKYTGFSVEAFCSFDEINTLIENNRQNNTEDMADKKASTILSKIKEILGTAFEDETVEVALEEQVQQEEVAETENVAEETVTEETVEVEAASDEVEATAEAQETVTEEAVEVEAEAQTEEAVQETVEEAVETDLSKENEELKNEVAELKKQIEKLSKQPSTKVAQSNPEEKKGVQSAFAQFKAMGII